MKAIMLTVLVLFSALAHADEFQDDPSALFISERGITEDLTGYDYRWMKPAFKLTVVCALFKGDQELKRVPNEKCYGQGEFLTWYKPWGLQPYHCALVYQFSDGRVFPIEKRADEECIGNGKAAELY